MIPLIDTNKVGTLILGYYRSGTHFLQDSITDTHPEIRQAGEICNDNTLDDLEQLTNSSGYTTCILNNTVPKFLLATQRDLLQKWHIINLTRNDKSHHFISHWFWSQNTQEQRMNNAGLFKHHGTEQSIYRAAVTQRQHVDIAMVVVWLQEQLINSHIPSDATVDYNDLPHYQTNNIHWRPNQYNLILQDLFTNYKEIQDLLLNFTI